MRPMCSDFLSPTLVQLFPPSIDLYTPSPYATTRCALFSPVPTHTTFGLLLSIVITPIENDPWPSKIGEKEIPPFVDFHTPPAAAPTYHVRLSDGSIAMSAMRPDVSAGPMERSFNPERRPVVNFELSGGAAGFLLFVFDCAGAITGITARRTMATARMRIPFIGVYEVRKSG